MDPAQGAPAEGAPVEGGAPEEGGAPAEEGAPAGEGGAADPQMIQQLASTLIEKLGPEVAQQVADAINEQLQGGGGGEQEAPQEPMYARLGGKMRRIL